MGVPGMSSNDLFRIYLTPSYTFRLERVLSLLTVRSVVVT